MKTKIQIIHLIEKTMELRKKAEDILYENRHLHNAYSYMQQREDLEYCLNLIKELKEGKE